PMEVEGNFGGVAHTDWIYDSCRLMLAEVIAKRRLNVVNCSDGALVPGARPCVPDALEIGTAAGGRQGFREALDRSTQAFASGRLLEECDLAAVALKTDALFAELDQLLDELAAGEGDFGEAYRKVLAFLATAKDRYAYTESIISGTLVAL